MPVAFDKRVGYFAPERISENIGISPEGYLICRNTVIGRTGFQTYKVSEIADPEGLLGERYKPDDELELWRDPSEVFAQATLDSFQGKTFTLMHPDELLGPDSDREHSIGVVLNVRKGDEPLKSGDWPMLADIIVKDREGIEAIQRGERELSCGYTYRLAREGYRWDQRELIGNHVALVPSARAGSEARIYDSAPKEKSKMKFNLKTLLGMGIKAAAADKDVSPEDLAEMGELLIPSRVVAKDEAPKPVEVKVEDKKPSVFFFDGKKFESTDGVNFRSVAKDDEASEEEKRAAMDKRKRLHDMLDRRMDDAEKFEAEKSEQDDADVEELKKLLGEKKEEKSEDATDEKETEKEEADDAHPPGCRCADCMGSDDSDVKDEDLVHSGATLAEGEKVKAFFDGAKTLSALKQFRKIIANSGDKRSKKAFNTLYDAFNRELKNTDGKSNSYAVFSAAARTENPAAKESRARAGDGDAKDWKPRESYSESLIKKNDDIYAKAGEKARATTLK